MMCRLNLYIEGVIVTVKKMCSHVSWLDTMFGYLVSQVCEQRDQLENLIEASKSHQEMLARFILRAHCF